MDFFFFIKVKIKMVCFSVPSKLPWGVCIIFNIVRITDLVMVCDGITGRDIQNIAQKN